MSQVVKLDEWDDKNVCELEKILTELLHYHFKHAIKTIVGCGYKEHDAETTVLRTRILHGSADIVSRIIASALASVKVEKAPHVTEGHVFESLESLVKYTLLEMISTLRAMKPYLTVLEAMWLILVWDFNVSNACNKEIGSHGSSSQATTKEKYVEPANPKYTYTPGRITESLNYPIPRSALQFQVTGGQSISLTVDSATQMSETLQVIADKVHELYQKSFGEENTGCSSKFSLGNHQNEMICQKEYLPRKIYKASTSKRTYKGKLIPLNSVSSSSGTIVKNIRSKISSSSGSVSENIYSYKTDSTSLTSVADTPNIMKDANFDNPSSSAIPSYYAGITYDMTLKKYIPQDEKDEAILELVPYLQKLQRSVGYFTNWASEKFEQGLTRIQQVKAEIKAVQKEKSEERFSPINCQTKRFEDMDQALAATFSLLETNNAALCQLGTVNFKLMSEKKSAEAKALESARDLQKALEQEKAAIKNSKSIDLDKRLLQEECTSLKRNAANEESKLEMAKVRLKQFEDQWEQENKEKLKYLSDAENLRVERKQLEALAKVEEKAIQKSSRCDIYKYREKIKNLEDEITVLKSEFEVLRIRKLRTRNVMDCGSSSMGSKNATDKKRERECVVCLAEERSVLFLPCAHQVVCKQCSIQYEKEMDECPTCRTPIQRRIQTRYHTSD